MFWLDLHGTHAMYNETTKHAFALEKLPAHLASRYEKYRSNLFFLNSTRAAGTEETVHSAKQILAIMQELPALPQPPLPVTN